MSRLNQLLTMLSESPGDPFLLFALAKEYEKQNQKEEARAHYQRLLKNHPDYVGIYYHLGKLYEQLGEREMADTTYRQGMDIARDQGDHHALSELTGAHGQLQDFLEEE